jgi:AraC-like DNA-binding protein
MKYLQVPPIPPRFRSDSVDEVRSYIARDDTEHSRQVLGTGPLGWEHVLLSGQALQLNWVTQRLGQIARGGYSAGAVVHVPLQGGQQYWFGRRRVDVEDGEAVFIVPGQHYDVRTQPGTVFALGLPLGSLEREIKPYIRSADSVWLPRTCKLNLASATAIAMLQQIDELTGILASAVKVPEVVLEQSEGDVLALLAEILAECGGAGRESKLTAERARAVEEWIEAHLRDPITLGRMCEVAEVGGRCLQKTFMDRRGCSPIQYVAQRRLDAARAQLANAVPGRDVTAIAMECGFTHMGRFSIMYRQRFGESPSATLRRRSQA